ncbi:hypothetical protein [Microbacterium aquilitoris]|uniref:hypothetical protein n=1 Tax=Microbacterium aquilitoris TaxID=3067307 RepID=UPI0028903D0D|nr:hypothetical protein [Microbacterium sp. KSW2-22]MDT3343771.1 hypothetical protein [Microbacterium sp. KSW2-22]
MGAQGTEFDFWAAAYPWIQGLVFFALGIVATIMVERRRAARGDFELWVWETSESLTKPEIGRGGDHLQYVINGTVVKEPYEVTVDVWANGRRDIPTNVFNGRDARVELNVPIVSQLEHQVASADETLLEVSDTNGTVLIHPSVVRRGMAARWTFLTDGKPSLRLKDAPMDTDFVSWRDTYVGPRRSKTAAKIIGFSMVGLGILSFVLSLVLRDSFAELSTAELESAAMLVGVSTSFLIVGGGATVMFGTSALGSRLRAARKSLSSRTLHPMPDSE